MMDLIANLISGLSLGSIYALIALGYTMVYGIAKMLNFAHGDIIMVGAFAVVTTVSMLGFPPILAIAASIVCCVVLGVCVERIAYKPLRKSPPLAVLITAIGVSYFLQSLALLIFGSTQHSFPKVISVPAIQLGSLTIQGNMLVTLAVMVVIMIAMSLFISKSKTGKAMRAVSEDRDAAELMGISVNRTITITFAIGSALAAVAGVFYGTTYGFIGPYTGSMPGIKAFVAAVFGGIGSIPGAVIGAFLIGICESLIKMIGLTEFSDAFTFALLIVILIFKPCGLFGEKTTEKV